MCVASYIKGYMGLPYQPMDIDEQAAAVLSSATRAVQYILDRRATLDQEGFQDKTLFVLAGEYHTMPIHQIHNMLLLDGLTKSEKVCVSIEREHSILQDIFSKNLSPYDANRFRTHDHQKADGSLSLKANLAFTALNMADYSSFNYYQMLIDKKIPTRHVDVRLKNEYQDLDGNDPSTRDSMDACANITKGDDFSVRSKNGMRIRNHHMTQMMMDFAQSSGARIMILNCGSLHIIGDFDDMHGVFDLLIARNAPVIALPVETVKSQSNWYLSKNYLSNAKSVFLLSDLPEDRAIYNGQTGRPILNREADMRSRAAEQSYFNSLQERTGMKDYALTQADYWCLRAQHGRHVNAVVETYNSYRGGP